MIQNIVGLVMSVFCFAACSAITFGPTADGTAGGIAGILGVVLLFATFDEWDGPWYEREMRDRRKTYLPSSSEQKETK